MGVYQFRVSASKPAANIAWRPKVARDRRSAVIDVTADDLREAEALALRKAKEAFKGFDVVRIRLVKRGD